MHLYFDNRVWIVCAFLPKWNVCHTITFILSIDNTINLKRMPTEHCWTDICCTSKATVAPHCFLHKTVKLHNSDMTLPLKERGVSYGSWHPLSHLMIKQWFPVFPLFPNATQSLCALDLWMQNNHAQCHVQWCSALSPFWLFAGYHDYIWNMIKTQVKCENTALKRSLLRHLPELLFMMEIGSLLTICLRDCELMCILVELKSEGIPHKSILTLPIMSLWKSNALAASKITEFCNLAIWMQEK